MSGRNFHFTFEMCPPIEIPGSLIFYSPLSEPTSTFKAYKRPLLPPSCLRERGNKNGNNTYFVTALKSACRALRSTPLGAFKSLPVQSPLNTA
jgi:hypothetical protein